MTRLAEQHPIFDTLIKPRSLEDLGYSRSHLKPEQRVARTDNEYRFLYSQEARAFWGEMPPDEVVIATGSTRKALMDLILQLGITFPGFTPYSDGGPDMHTVGEAKYFREGYSQKQLDLQTLFNERIFNGNKHLVGKVLLFYLHEVPVYVQMQDGETSSNEDPLLEARNKVEYLHDLEPGKNVLYISTDTIDRPDTTEKYLGKPMYEKDFPRLGPYSSDEAFYQAVELFRERLLVLGSHNRHKVVQMIELILACYPQRQGFTPEELSKAETAYLQLYKEVYFPQGSTIFHTNALAILDGLAGKVLEPQQQLLLTFVVGEHFDGEAQASKDVGGGGLLQKFILWDEEGVMQLLEAADPLTRDVLTKLYAETDLDVLRWALYCQITGSPWHQMKELLGEASRSRQRTS